MWPLAVCTTSVWSRATRISSRVAAIHSPLTVTVRRNQQTAFADGKLQYRQCYDSARSLSAQLLPECTGCCLTTCCAQLLAASPRKANGSPWTQVNLNLSPFVKVSDVCYHLVRDISGYGQPTAWQEVLEKLTVGKLLNKFVCCAEPKY